MGVVCRPSDGLHRQSWLVIDGLDRTILIALPQVGGVAHLEGGFLFRHELYFLSREGIELNAASSNVATPLAFSKAGFSAGFERVLGIGHSDPSTVAICSSGWSR